MMIQLKNIDVIFSKKQGESFKAVNQVTLSVKKGEMFGIVGYSGAGKSTLVRVINLLQKPAAGSVIVNGQDLLALSEKQLRQTRKKIGMIFQHFNLMNARTVYENILYPLRHAPLSKAEKEQKISQLLTLVGLSDKRNVYPSQLSGGQKQRVAIARALANDPEILLCDEATSALDPKTTQAILKLLKELNQRLGLTIVLITHEMQVVKAICHRVAVMEHGQVIEQGNIVDIFSQPKQPLTQDFIRTASHIEQAYETILRQPTLAKRAPDEHVVELNYRSPTDFTPFISELFQRYAIVTTILYCHLDIIQQQPVGSLIVMIKGSDEQLAQAEHFLGQQNITLHQLNSLQNENFYTI